MNTDAILAVSLTGIKPNVTRTVQLPHELPLNRLHEALQIAMGWEDLDPHIFEYDGEQFANRKQVYHGGVRDEKTVKLSDLLEVPGDQLLYLYDLTDQWLHRITLEGFAPESPYPVILAAKGACPPEQCGGAYGYGELKAALKDRSHPLNKIMPGLRQIAPDFTYFDVGTANLDLMALGGRWQKRRRPRKPRPINGCRALMIVDNEPIRENYRRIFQDAQARVTELEQLLTSHRENDLPGFRRAVSATFGQHMTRLRDLKEKIDRFNRRLDLMRQVMALGVTPSAAAYDRAIRIELGELPTPIFPSARTPRDGQNSAVSHESEFLREQLRACAANLGAGELFSEEDLNDIVDRAMSEEPPIALRGECRTVYRKIVLALHPDRAGQMSESETALWLKAQEAYQNTDLLGLKLVWAQSAGVDLTKAMSCSELLAATAEADIQWQSLNLLHIQLAADPSWQFASLNKRQRTSRLRQVEKQFDADEGELQSELVKLRAECERLDQLRTRWLEKKRGALNQLTLL